MAAPSSIVLKASSFALAAALLLIPSLARAERPGSPPEGNDRVILSDIVGLRSGGLGYLSMMAPGYGSAAMSGLVGYARQESVSAQYSTAMNEVREVVSVNPSIDVFVTRRLTLGASIGFAHSEVVDTGFDAQAGVSSRLEQSSNVFGVAPRVGYMVPLGHGFSLWPRVGVAYSRARGTSESVYPTTAWTGSSASEQLVGGVDVALIFRPTRYLYLSAGPELSVAGSRFEQQQAGYAYYGSTSFSVRMAGVLSMGLVL